MSRILLLLFATLTYQSVLAQTEGRVLIYPDPARHPDAPARIEFSVTHAVAMPNEQNDIYLYLLPEPVPLDDLDRALHPEQLFKFRLDALALTHLWVTLRPERNDAIVSLRISGADSHYLGNGALAGGRVEDGRLRGRLILVSDYDGRALADVAIDAPLIKPATALAEALPADGGEPWQSLLRLRAAVAAGDETRMRALMMPSLAQDMPTGPDFLAELPTLQRQFPMLEPLEGGWQTEVDARLVLLRSEDGEPLRVLMDMARDGRRLALHGRRLPWTG